MKSSPSSSSSSYSSVPLPPAATAEEQARPKKTPNQELNSAKKSLPNKRRTKRTPNEGENSAGRSSKYRGVTKHRWSGRFEAHLWDKNSWNIIQNKRGRQVYLGAFDDENVAARTYDLAALKYWGPDAILNFSFETYREEYEHMQHISREEYLGSLRRKSSGFARGISKYRGVARHHHNGRWEARIGRVLGNKYLYLGTFSTQEEAAAAYDIAAIQHRGLNAVTNFDISNYIRTPPPFHHEFPYFTESQEVPGTPMLSGSVDQSTIMEDGMDDSSWNLCMENEFNQLRVPDISMQKSSELLDVFYDNSFEENLNTCLKGMVLIWRKERGSI